MSVHVRGYLNKLLCNRQINKHMSYRFLFATAPSLELSALMLSPLVKLQLLPRLLKCVGLSMAPHSDGLGDNEPEPMQVQGLKHHIDDDSRPILVRRQAVPLNVRGLEDIGVQQLERQVRAKHNAHGKKEKGKEEAHQTRFEIAPCIVKKRVGMEEDGRDLVQQHRETDRLSRPSVDHDAANDDAQRAVHNEVEPRFLSERLVQVIAEIAKRQGQHAVGMRDGLAVT